MIRKLADFGSREWYRVAGWAIFGTVGWLVSSSVLLLFFRGAGSARDIAIDTILLSTALVMPFLFFLGLKLGEISLLKQRIAQALTQDSLTSCLNGATFSALVDAYVGLTKLESEDCRGAFLVIDADHFNSLNERFGHGWGDRALRIIAGIIRSSVRSGDLVGRLGGQEFGVFLPGANRANAEDVAERIRIAIAEARFAPVGSAWPLTVSAGAVLFENQVEFEDLFSEANRQLREAKTGGRNRVVFSQIQSGSTGAVAPPSLH